MMFMEQPLIHILLLNMPVPRLLMLSCMVLQMLFAEDGSALLTDDELHGAAAAVAEDGSALLTDDELHGAAAAVAEDISALLTDAELHGAAAAVA